MTRIMLTIALVSVTMFPVGCVSGTKLRLDLQVNLPTDTYKTPDVSASATIEKVFK